MPIPACAAASRTTPRAWPSFSVDWGFSLTNTSSTAAVSGRCSASTAASPSWSVTSRAASAIFGSVLICPLARWRSRFPSAAITPQPVVPSPGSRPRMIIGGRREEWSPAHNVRLGSVREANSEPLHHLVGDLVIAPDGLDVVILLEAVDQLDQLAGIVAADLDRGGGTPGELDALGLAKRILERAGDAVEIV